MIFEQSGMYTALKVNTVSDHLAHTIANALVGNDQGVPTVEMTFVPAAIYFDEPTLISLTGADFKAHTKDKAIAAYKVHLMEHGDILYFDQPTKGTRVYMAIAGGIDCPHVDDAYFVQDGDTFELLRNYSKTQKNMLLNLQQSKETTWGVDTYALSRLYYSDIFHLIEDETTLDESIKKTIVQDIYEVTNRIDRHGFVLEGAFVQSDFETNYEVRSGAIQVKDKELIVVTSPLNKIGKYPTIAYIADYHLPKLSQKKPGSILLFKWITKEEYTLQRESYDHWVKSLLNQINYQLKMKDGK